VKAIWDPFETLEQGVIFAPQQTDLTMQRLHEYAKRTPRTRKNPGRIQSESGKNQAVTDPGPYPANAGTAWCRRRRMTAASSAALLRAAIAPHAPQDARLASAQTARPDKTRESVAAAVARRTSPRDPVDGGPSSSSGSIRELPVQEE
jgi:hypothetical protein